MGEEWIVDLESELGNIDPSAEIEREKKQCICKVPNILRGINPAAYTPQLISFGPYHRDKDHLRPMEHHKRRALSNFLRRAHMTLSEVAEAMMPELQDLMDCYDGLEDKWTAADGRFLKLMILDGCAFLDLMIWHTVEVKPYMEIRLWMDMLRLENQLPLAVLAVLIEVGGNKDGDTKNFIKRYPNTPHMRLESIRGMGLHHLDICRKSETLKGNYYYDHYSSVPPATELFQASVRFEKSDSTSMKDISFHKGVLRLPCIKVDESTEPSFLNYLAYEQLFNLDYGVTSYAFLMDNMINNAKDVMLLREKGILHGWVGSDDNIASIFNRLTKARTFFAGAGKVNVNKNLNDYCNKRWNRWRASFMRTHLNNPWGFISLVAAFIMLLLTVTHTTHTTLPLLHIIVTSFN